MAAFPSRSRVSTLTFAFLCAFASPLSAQAVNVDTELVILVDAQTFSTSDFDLILDGVARSFEQQSFVNAVASGANGQIAASLVLFNSNNNSLTANIPWMVLSSATDLQNFADTVRNVENTAAFGNVSYAEAISFGAAQIASSTIVGANRQLTIIDDGTGFNQVAPAATQAARDNALASSVDVINGVIFDVAFQENTAETYYNNYVVGGVGGGVEVIGSPQGGPKTGEDLEAIEEAIAFQITGNTISNLSVVPEPSSLAFLLVGSLGLLGRRRR